MSKATRLRELSDRIKETYNLDSVTAVSSKSQYRKIDLPHDPTKVYFKMRYRLTGDDVVQLCPISWVAINANEDDLIVRVCGEVLSAHPDVKAILKPILSSMAQNAVLRSGNGT